MCTHTTCTLLVTNSRDEGKEPGTHSLSRPGEKEEKEELHGKSERMRDREGERVNRELLSGNLIKRKDAASIQPFQLGCNQIKLTSSKWKQNSNPGMTKPATFHLLSPCKEKFDIRTCYSSTVFVHFHWFNGIFHSRDKEKRSKDTWFCTHFSMIHFHYWKKKSKKYRITFHKYWMNFMFLFYFFGARKDDG